MNQPLRIAMFVGSFPTVSETFILRHIIGLLDLGHEVDIYANSRSDGDSPLQPEVLKYDLLRRTTYIDAPPETSQWEMPIWPIIGRTWPPGSESSMLNVVRVGRALPRLIRCLMTVPRLTCQVLRPAEYGYQASSLSALYRLEKLVAQPKGYDVLHAHFGPVANSFRFARELWQAPLVTSFHGYDFCTSPREESPDMYQKLFQTADAVVVNSDYTRGRVEKLGCPATKLHRIPVGLDLEEFPFRPRERKAGEPIRLLTVARLVEIKGHEYAIRAVARLRERNHEIHYDIVGEGPLRKSLEELVRQLGLQQTVTFQGALNSTGIKQLLSDAHLFLLASVSVEGDQEGQGLVLQEAQAVGLPVIATAHGAFPEGILAGQSGFLVPERDVDALARQLHHLIEHPETWTEMGRCGRRFVSDHFNVRALNAELAELYDDVIKAFRQKH